MNEATLSAQIPAALHDQLAKLASALGRDYSSLIAEALQRFIATETQTLEAINEGIDAAARGDIISHEAVVAMMAERRRRLRQRPER